MCVFKIILFLVFGELPPEEVYWGEHWFLLEFFYARVIVGLLAIRLNPWKVALAIGIMRC